jgi:SAM-dependent methyltransferase
MKLQKIKPYRWLALYYDKVFGAYRPWAEQARKTLLADILPKVGSACDLACGTGTTAIWLASQGIRTFGADLSPGMFRAARGKVRAAGLPIQIQQADMCSFRLPEKVDLVLCEYDALNHVPRKSDLARVARAVGRALKPGGHFFFDVNNRLGFQSYWKGTWCVEKPGLFLVMNNGNDAAHDRAWSKCEWFIRQGRLWRRRREIVREVCWSLAEMRRAFKMAGFDRVRAWDSSPFFKDAPHIKRGCRTHYLARKAPVVTGRKKLIPRKRSSKPRK